MAMFFIPKPILTTEKWADLALFKFQRGLPDNMPNRSYDPKHDVSIIMVKLGQWRSFEMSLDPQEKAYGVDSGFVVLRDGTETTSTSFVPAQVSLPQAAIQAAMQETTPVKTVPNIFRPAAVIGGSDNPAPFIRLPRILKDLQGSELIKQAQELVCNLAIPALQKLEKEWASTDFYLKVITIEELEVQLRLHRGFINHTGRFDSLFTGFDLLQYWQKGDPDMLRQLKEYPQVLMFVTKVPGEDGGLEPSSEILAFKVNSGNFRDVQGLRNRLREEYRGQEAAPSILKVGRDLLTRRQLVTV